MANSKVKFPNIGRVASTAVEAYSGVSNTGVLFLSVAEVAREEMGEAMFTKEQADSIIQSVTAARGWADDGRNPKPRQSELRNILRTFREAPKAVAAFKEQTGREEIGYDDYVKVCRKLSQTRGAPQAWGDKAPPTLPAAKVTAAVTKALEAAKPVKKNPTKASQRDEAVKALTKLRELRANWMPKGFHDELDKLIAKFG